MLILPNLNVLPPPAEVHRQLVVAHNAQKLLKKLLKLSIEAQAEREALNAISPLNETGTTELQGKSNAVRN